MPIAELFDLSGLRALVTGGNSGLGRAMATALGLAGASVVLVARRTQELQDSAVSLRTRGIEAHWQSGDLSAPQGALECAAQVTERFGRVDILVNAAGCNHRKPVQEVTPQSWTEQLHLNLGAPFFLARNLAPAMARRGWGRIINLASLASCRALPDGAPYGAAKAGLVQLTRNMAREWSSSGVTCNAIAPGFFPTPLTEPVFSNPSVAAMHAANTCAGRNGNLEDIHGLTVFLASRASAYVTGQTIMLDGGYTAR